MGSLHSVTAPRCGTFFNAPFLAQNMESDMIVKMLSQMVGTVAVAAALSGVGIPFTQNAPATSPMNTIGTPAAKSEIVPSLFVLNSRGATLKGDTLTLTGVMPHSIISPIVR
jgi:hypothetical protein